MNVERPLTTVDMVLFSVLESQLSVLLKKRCAAVDDPFPNHWALPGGCIDVERDENLEASARRKVIETVGVEAPYLEQLGSFGDAVRDPRGWSTAHVYLALMSSEGLVPWTKGDKLDIRWFSTRGECVEEPLAFDHAWLLRAALLRLRSKAEYTSLPVFLLPCEFTLTQLQRIYEVILGRALEKSAFRTRMLAVEFLEVVSCRNVGPYRPTRLYRLKRQGTVHNFLRPFGTAERRTNRGVKGREDLEAQINVTPVKVSTPT
jgi:8-oxo-dGTP diphosphatase